MEQTEKSITSIKEWIKGLHAGSLLLKSEDAYGILPKLLVFSLIRLVKQKVCSQLLVLVTGKVGLNDHFAFET